MHIGKCLAMLNAKNARFDVGAGGIPNLISTDVAGALAFVEKGLGRELLCRTWWPAGARLTEAQLVDTLDRLIRAEWARRESVMDSALMAVVEYGPKAQRQYRDASDQRWPDLVLRRKGEDPVADDRYASVRNAVLDEVASAGLCPACGGSGEVRNHYGVVATCSTCTGEGHFRMGDRERAKASGFAWSTYQGGWIRVYDWTFQLCVEALHRAERQFAAALRDE